MRYYWRVFLWENGRRSTEYTKYTNAPIFLEDKLDETLDSGEIILMGMPIATKAAFPPKTKFRLERYNTADFSDTPKKWDMIVEHDDVEEYTGCPDLCTHRVHLIEASAVAQGMHVDNIALTYELQDVDLNYRTSKEGGGKTDVKNIPCGYAYDVFEFGGRGAQEHTSGRGYLLDYPAEYWNYYYKDRPSISHFETAFKFVWSDTEVLEGLTSGLAGRQVNHVEFSVPKLTAYVGTGSGWSPVCEVPTRTTVFFTKYSRRAKKSDDGSYVQDEAYPLETLESGMLVDVTSFPSDTNTFKELEGRTKLVGNRLVAISPQYAGHIYSEGDGSEIILAKWINDKADLIPMSISDSVRHYDKLKFDTRLLTEEDALYTDENGNTFMVWYEYAIQTREAVYEAADDQIYQVMGVNVLTHQKYTATGGWFTDAQEQKRETFMINMTRDALETFNSKNDTEPSVYVSTLITVSGLFADVSGGTFLMKGVKYSCYDLLQKALLTLDTQILNNATEGLDGLKDRYPIVADAGWSSRLKAMKMQETVFEQKNLWEILLQIGYYLHAVPYLEFSEDGTDRFVLFFRQLGATKKNFDTNTKITVFNSRNLSEYFTQYDSYVTNLFSPQNEVDEWLVPKTSDSTYLVSNNTAELHTSRQIVELTAFEIIYNGRTVDALPYIFEESIYQVLTSDNPKMIRPAKGNALYYKLGSNVIGGLNYTPPESSGGTYWHALKEICRRLFGTDDKLKFNDLMFHARYRTQDDMRLSQVRPDIQNFMRNSAYEQYPHHEQYYGQQDKIIDSERFSANLFGKLIRVGNAVYQRQELVRDFGGEKESGDLVEIGGEAYYVTATENEYYPDVILQKVTYSKNFNQLSNIVTIPSEPRFYEVSERSKVRREVRLMDFLELSTTEPTRVVCPRYLNNITWKSFISALIFNRTQVALPNFAYTRFSADYKRDHIGSYGQIVSSDVLFPSSEVERGGENSIKPKDSKGYSDCIVPLMNFPLHDGIVFEWDMEDNFKAGDYIDRDVSDETNGVDDAYIAQQSHRYVDVMGRADLFTFRLFRKSNWTHEQAQKLPMAVITPSESDCIAYLPSPYTIGLDKDNREELSFNYQINLLHRPTEDDKDDFFTFPNLFGHKESPLKMCFLGEPQSLLDESINLSPAFCVADNVPYLPIENATKGAIEVRITQPLGVNLDDVKSIALYQENEDGGRSVYIVKNVHRLSKEKKLRSWWIVPVLNI